MRERLEITGSTCEPWDYASWIRPVGGAVIDGVLTVAAQTPGSFGIGLMIIATTTTKRRDGSSSTQVTSHGLFNAGLTLAIVTYLIVLAFVIWNQILRPGRTGQSLGKQIIGIRLLKETGEPLGAWLTCGRQLLHVLDSLPCFLGWLWPLWDRRRQTFADKLVSSIVVSTSQQLPRDALG